MPRDRLRRAPRIVFSVLQSISSATYFFVLVLSRRSPAVLAIVLPVQLHRPPMTSTSTRTSTIRHRNSEIVFSVSVTQRAQSEPDS
jgi:hypothetical protein